MNEIIPYGKQELTEQDITSVVNVLKSDYWTQGPVIGEFEKAFAEYVNSKYAIAVANGTAALHLCAMAMNIEQGQKVITTPITFAASANCIRYCGGEVVFGDIDPKTYLLDIKYVKKLLNESPKGTYAGIIPVDFAGNATNLEEFRQLANEYNLWIIEDACHAPGGSFLKKSRTKSKCGSGEFADLAIFSFHPVKHIAAGEGGMITTTNKELYERILTLRTHGIIKDNSKFSNSKEFAAGIHSNEYPKWYMEMQELGYNYRISDILAALGLSQLSRASEGVIQRRKIAEVYFRAFKNKDYIIGQSGIISGHAYHLYVIEVKNRLELYNYLRSNGIYAQIHYVPCHLMPYYRSLGWKEGDLPNAENYYKNCISLPMFPGLRDENQQKVISLIKSFYER